MVLTVVVSVIFLSIPILLVVIKVAVVDTDMVNSFINFTTITPEAVSVKVINLVMNLTVTAVAVSVIVLIILLVLVVPTVAVSVKVINLEINLVVVAVAVSVIVLIIFVNLEVTNVAVSVSDINLDIERVNTNPSVVDTLKERKIFFNIITPTIVLTRRTPAELLTILIVGVVETDNV